MTIGVWFYNEPKNKNYYYLFEIGVDVIITDYPIAVREQLHEYNKNIIYLEGCESISKNSYNLATCDLCKKGYELTYINEYNRTLCKLKYELDPDLYIKNDKGVYYEKNIFAIKMLYSPIKEYFMCQKNDKTIFYFEWLFDLYGYDYYSYSSYYYNYFYSRIVKYILSIESEYGYGKLNEKQIKKLNFNNIEIYVDNNLINKNDFLCIDLYDAPYYSYRVMGAHCYILYNGEQKTSYNVEFKLFDNNY